VSHSTEPRRQHPEQRREEILDAAVRLFCEKGYEGTTIRDIARAVGVTEGLLYHYFPSKAALIAECWKKRSWHARAVALVEGAQDKPFQEVLLGLIRDHLNALYEHGPSFRMHAAEMLRDGDLAETSQHYIHETHSVIADYIRGQQARGTVRSDADPEVVTGTIMGTDITFFMVHGRLPEAQWKARADHMAREFNRLLVRALATDPRLADASAPVAELAESAKAAPSVSQGEAL
jgi:AcrR family transcriptional regulator